MPWTAPRPRSDRDFARLLVAKAAPGVSEEAIETILDTYRGANNAKADIWGSHLTPQNTKDIDGILDKDDVKEVQEKLLSAHANAVVTRQGRPSAVAGSGGSKSRAPTRLKDIPFSGEVSREQASQLIPKVKGCNLLLDRKRHMRWVCSYPNDTAPFSKSAVWNEDRSSFEALLSVVDWAWKCHAAATGEACPWNLEGKVASA